RPIFYYFNCNIHFIIRNPELNFKLNLGISIIITCSRNPEK
ncbi:unnamed protein product, partial [marine sediment metagenome]